jgi:hypothetical protein
MKFFHRFVWVCLVVFALWAVQAGVNPFWYDDVCHTLTAACTAMQGYECFPECWPLHPETPTRPGSGLITTGPLLNYWLALWLRVSGFSWYVPRIAMVALNTALFVACWGLFNSLERNNRPKGQVWFWAWLVLPLTQTQVYGSQVIGEVTCGLFLVLGTALWSTEGKRHLGGLCLLAACFTKEYAFPVIGVHMLLEYLTERKIYPLIWVAAAALANSCYYILRFPDSDALWSYLSERSTYQAEFLAFEWETVGWFLLTKPISWVGWLAAWIEFRVRGLSPPAWALWRMQGLLLIFFVLGSGFDRFGWLTLPIGTWFVAAWLAAAWRHTFRRYTQKAGPVVILTLASIPSIWGVFQFSHAVWNAGQQNKPEKEFSHVTNAQLADPEHRIWLADLAIVPFLPSGGQVWLPIHAPVYARTHPTTLPDTCTHWIAGPYSITEYGLTEPLDSCGSGSVTYWLVPRSDQQNQGSNVNRRLSKGIF